MSAVPPLDPVDVVGVGIGPFNLSLAALADTVPGLRALFLERQPEFSWHPGLLIDGATLQVPFLADLVSLVEPASPLSFLSYLKDRGRLFPFYFAERFHVPRQEYDAYCRWASARLPSCAFGRTVDRISRSGELFTVSYNGPDGPREVLTRNVVLGVGTEPSVPAPLRDLVDDPDVLVVHSADYLRVRDRLTAVPEVVVVGSGQSGAEVFLDLLRRRRGGVRWFARTPAFTPMEYSKLGLEQFTPDYTRFFRALPEPVRDRLVPAQWQLYKGIDTDTIAAIFDELYERSVDTDWPDVTLTPGAAVTAARRVGARVELELTHLQQGSSAVVHADAVVLATGYAERDVSKLLAPVADGLPRDAAGRFTVDGDHRIAPGLFVQNAERHTHGVGAPDLGLAAWRSATILNAICGRTVHPLPDRTAFTTFGLGGVG